MMNITVVALEVNAVAKVADLVKDAIQEVRTRAKVVVTYMLGPSR